MKKRICLLLCALVAGTLLISASAEEAPSSGDTPVEPVPPACSHTYDGGIVTTAPTCTQAGVKTFTCTKCGNTYTESIAATGVHTWDAGTLSPAPTCSQEGTRVYTCSGCGTTKTESVPVDPSAHTFGAWNAGQEGSHTRTCSGCGKSESASHVWDVTATVPATCKEEGATAYGCSTCGRIEYEIIPKLTTHTYDNVCDPDCNVCGFVREASHTFSTVWSKNAQGHWHVCTKCGEKTDMGNHYPGPAATEEQAQICLTCGYTLTARLNHVHQFATVWSCDETGHWYACSGCEEQKDFAEHVYDNACDPDCNICGYQTETAHTTDGTWLSDEASHWSICTVCGEICRQAEHTPDPDTAPGEAVLCSVCGYEISPAEEHIHEGGEAWLSDEVSHWKECDCGEILEKSDHVWDDGVESDAHSMVYTCSVCAAERVEELPSDGFPVGIVLIVLVVVILAAAAVLVLLLIRNRPAGKYGR